MRTVGSLLAAAVLMASCTGPQVAYRKDLDRHSTVIAGVRTEVADTSKALHATRTEVEILEDRLVQQSQEMARIVNELRSSLASVEAKAESIGNQQVETEACVQQLVAHAEKSHKTVAHTQKEMRSLRSDLNQQLTNTKRALESVMAAAYAAPHTYEVRRGDTLEKIARAHNTTIEELKLANQLSSDTIFPQQQLRLPQ